MFKSFPREVGPPRKVVYNIQDWLKYINIYNGKKKAVYTSIYSFNIIDGYRPEYDSAIIDKLFFDFDDKSCNAYEECKKLHKYLLEKNIKHCIMMSGRGYHLYVFTTGKPKNKKACIYNAQHFFIDKLNVLVDPQVIGNPAQLARVPNTFNSKGQRFCIPVTKDEFDKGDESIKKLSSKQQFVNNIIHGECFDIIKFDKESEKNKDIDFTIEDSKISKYSCPPCIKNILKEDAGWKERYLIILYFKEMGYTKQEIFNILKENLSTKKFNHCIKDEKQLQYLYERDDLVFPTCDKLCIDGICLRKCKQYNTVIYK